jgi:hypothetical protein
VLVGLIAFFAGGCTGLCIGVYLVADRLCSTRTGCIACGRSWQQPEHELDRTPSVRVIGPDVPYPLPQGDDA